MKFRGPDTKFRCFFCLKFDRDFYKKVLFWLENSDFFLYIHAGFVSYRGDMSAFREARLLRIVVECSPDLAAGCSVKLIILSDVQSNKRPTVCVYAFYSVLSSPSDISQMCSNLIKWVNLKSQPSLERV